MDWEQFMRGNLAIYCASETEAKQCLDMLDAQGLGTEQQRELLHGADAEGITCHSYRWDIGEWKLYSASLGQEDSWEWHAEQGFVNSVCRFSEIAGTFAAPLIVTLDGLL